MISAVSSRGSHSKIHMGRRSTCNNVTKIHENSSKFGDKMRRMRLDEPGPTVVAHLAKDGYMFVHPTENRTITVREAARMQSFPDSFDFSAGGTVAFTHQMRQVGNAVPPLLGIALGEIILAYLKEEINLSLEEVFGEDFPNLAD